MNAYIIIFKLLCAICASILLYVFRDGLRASCRYIKQQYTLLPDGLRNLLHGYIGVGIAELWLHAFHWSAWLLIALSVLAVVYALIQYARASRRDLDKRIRQMLRNNRSTVQGIAFLLASAGIGYVGIWVWWILTHEVV